MLGVVLRLRQLLVGPCSALGKREHCTLQHSRMRIYSKWLRAESEQYCTRVTQILAKYHIIIRLTVEDWALGGSRISTGERRAEGGVVRPERDRSWGSAVRRAAYVSASNHGSKICLQLSRSHRSDERYRVLGPGGAWRRHPLSL
jgi:hypothetical protein